MKVLVSDFDNTLFTDDYQLNIKKINEFVDKGNLFIIATGRNYNQLKSDIKGKNIKYSYLICEDGAKISIHKRKPPDAQAADRVDRAHAIRHITCLTSTGPKAEPYLGGWFFP